ncbi:hypothetical protein B0H19DRAFT_1061773 [Mycena capillaripes]|nr:hypothetical protein B0H19DRAFT_1061773 [Mycena capillaripes]
MTHLFSRFSRRPRSQSSRAVTQTRNTSNDHATPTTEAYMMSAGKQLAETLENLASVIPVPFLAEFVKVAITVIKACEACIPLECMITETYRSQDATEIEESVKGLQQRVHQLALTIIELVPVGEVSADLQARIKGLHCTLDDIVKDLAELKQQSRFLLIFFRDINKERVDSCVARVDAALEQFHVAHEIRAEELLDRITSHCSAVTKQLDKIEQTVNDINKPHAAPSTVTIQDMPTKRELFYGRQLFVDDITYLLTNEAASRVCITGPGGMGKTSLALAVMESAVVNQIFRKEYQFWVPCVEAKSVDLLRRILYTQLRITAESYDTLDPLIRELDASQDRRILLLDNFETAWLSGHDQDKTSTYYSLGHHDFGIPPTDDIEWQHRELPSLDPAAARTSFKRIYPAVVDGPKLDELLDAIDRIPLAIVLMANVGKHSRASPEYLLEQWRQTGTDMISRGSSQSMDRTISMSVNREVVASNSEASTLLAILSMLPAGTTGSNLSWWAPRLSSHIAAIEILRTAALVEQGDGDFETSRIFVRPTIQAYMARQDRIPENIREQVHDTCYRYVLNHQSVPDDAKFKSDLVALGSEQTNIQGLLMQIDVRDLYPRALDALIAFSCYQLYTKPSTVVISHALEMASEAQVFVHHVAEAHHCLGKIFHRLDRYEAARQHFEEARRHFKSLRDGPDYLRAGICSMSLADTWARIFDDSQEIDDKERQREAALEAKAYLSFDASNKYHVARGLLAYGRFLHWTEESEEALTTLQSALEIFTELDRPASIAECLAYMARTYAWQGHQEDAGSAAERALSYAERAGYLQMIDQSLRLFAANRMWLGRHDEAFELIARALATTQAMGYPLGIAHNLELLGFNRAAKQDIGGSRVAYEGALAQFKNIASHEGRRSEARCAANLETIECNHRNSNDLRLGLKAPEVMATRGPDWEHMAFDTVISAYNKHHALVIRPDDVWICILTQFNYFVTANAELLRANFVAHEGKEKLSVTTEGTRYGLDFGAMSREMVDQLERSLVDPSLRAWVLPDFSTTAVTDTTVRVIVMMATLKAFFEYEFCGIECGIPRVTLLGERSDYENILGRLEKLKEYGLEAIAWYHLLRPVIARFVAAFDAPKSAANVDFWQKVAHYENMVRLYGAMFHQIDNANMPPSYGEVDVKLDDTDSEGKDETKRVRRYGGVRISWEISSSRAIDSDPRYT